MTSSGCRRSALPIDPRSAFHPKGSAQAPAQTTPVAPPASATRMMAPTFPGSCTSTAITTSGVPRYARELSGGRASAIATMGLGDRTGLSARMTTAVTAATGTPRVRNCWANAVAESFFSTLKMELVHDADFATRDQARAALFEYIEVFYNRQRRHSSLGYVSPVEYERLASPVALAA